eukprot:TRINITY_DN8870_c0_g2_i1.p2 TRINITY_DN8870_c0_g2~~TRINITY_DN8870_c0_g2_i1.p2  ORF type:complete len:158 (+),score=22.42 TRINITY_DN8870_c0_g2_i1:62-475(+)
MCIRDRSRSEQEKPDEQDDLICEICFGKYTEKVHFQGGEHPICKSCYVDYLTNEIMNGQVVQIKCPHCNIEMKEFELKLFLSSDLLAKYYSFRKIRLAQINPLATGCPALNCEGIAVLKSKKRQKGSMSYLQSFILP